MCRWSIFGLYTQVKKMKKTEKTKKFRDPVYGYIEIEESIVHNIIDTAAFQRLRNIRQTSYQPLYPSSLHNRFVHSLGVYHLGSLAFASIRKSLESNKVLNTKVLGELDALVEDKIDRYEQLFGLACLLHDVGHSPFSHTGEDFYLSSKSDVQFISDDEKRSLDDKYKQDLEQTKDEGKKKKITEEYLEQTKYTIYKHLAFLTNDAAFKEARSYDAASHEIMSCIIALETFGKDERYFKDDDERTFFSRCITGVQYSGAFELKQKDFIKMDNKERDVVRLKMLLNCFIQLLHSSVIDVDRLDYIIRDASTMGYQSVSVDYERLLSGMEIILVDEYRFTVGFHKNAISVIENAVYAHDNEKKWVQSHPAILYESYLLKQAIFSIEGCIVKEFPNSTSTLFSYCSLTSKGSVFNEQTTNAPNLQIRYLSDADLVFLMKNRYQSTYSEEYFCRNTRRLPVWKSESEFMNMFDEGERKTITSALDILLNSSSGAVDSIEITDNSLVEINDIIEQACRNDHSNQVEFAKKKFCYAEALLKVFDRHGIKKNVALLSKSFFKSNFSKETMRKLPVLFPGSEKTSRLGEVSTTLSSEQVGDGKLVYLFYYPRENREKIDVHLFSADLLKAFKGIKDPAGMSD